MKLHDLVISTSDPGITKIYIDGAEIYGVTDISMDAGVDRCASTQLTILPGRCDIGMLSDVGLNVNVTSVQDAAKCIRLAMALDREFFKAIILSAKSAIDEVRNKNQTDVVNDYELAKRIVYRVFWGDEIENVCNEDS